MAIDLDLNAIVAGQAPTQNNGRANYWYKLDDGTYSAAYGLNSNLAELLGFSKTVPSGGVVTTAKKVTRRRTISFADATGYVKGEYEVGSPTAAIYTGGGSILIPRKGFSTGLLVYIVGTQGEKTRFIDKGIFTDTEQTGLVIGGGGG